MTASARHIAKIKERADQCTVRAAALVNEVNRMPTGELPTRELAALVLQEAQVQATLALAAEVRLLRMCNGHANGAGRVGA